MTYRLAIKRLLERVGFVHVAGWVRAEDAPTIKAKIKAARDAVKQAKAQKRRGNIPSKWTTKAQAKVVDFAFGRRTSGARRWEGG
jgi:hypothetical protein